MVVGRFYDRLVEAGGTAIFEEIVEAIGLDWLLVGRAANDKAREELRDTYDKALAYNDENILVLNNYAYFLSLLDRELLVAMNYATTANKLSPNNATYLDTLAWVMHRVGSNDEAKRIMQQALSIDGQRDPDLLAHYGDILWALGEKFMAETYWKKAVERGYDSQRMEEHIAQLKAEPKHDK